MSGAGLPDGRGGPGSGARRMRTLKVALLGCGVVGGAVARQLAAHADDLAARIGAPVELGGVAVRRPGISPRFFRPRRSWDSPVSVHRFPAVGRDSHRISEPQPFAGR